MSKVKILETFRGRSGRISWRSLRALWRHSCDAATLVEVLLYVSVFSLASVGFFTLVKHIKTDTVVITQSLDDAGHIDLARKHIQTALGKADQIRVFDTSQTTGACLQLEETKIMHRRGVHFDNDTKAISSASSINIAQQSSFSVAFWVRFDVGQQGRTDIINWGRFAENQLFAVLATNGILSLDFIKAAYTLDQSVDLRDNRWHHVAITYDGQTTRLPLPQSRYKLYIDGVHFEGTYRSYSATYHSHLNAGSFATVHVGFFPHSYYGKFRGAVSDLRLWGAKLSPEHVSILHNDDPQADSLLANNLRFHWPLQNLNDGQTLMNDTTGNGVNAVLSGFTGASDILQVADQAVNSTTFCFHDENRNQYFTLWKSQKATTAPQATPDPRVWRAISQDVFVRDQDGFFTAISNRPDSVTANIVTNSTVQSSSFSSKVSFKNRALCKVATDNVVTATGCGFSRAYAWVQAGYQQADDELQVFNVQPTQSDSNAPKIYQNIPFAPSTVVATWNAATGILTFHTNDGSRLDAAKWNHILQQVVYAPTIGASGAKKIGLAVGSIPFIQDDRLHFYDFVRQTDGIHDFATANQQAVTRDNKYCGIQPYLMTVTSEAEHNFVKAKMIQAYGDWQNGWIGASRDENRRWHWRGGPDNQTLFWVGDGRGAPVNATGANAGRMEVSRRFFAHDFDQSNPINFTLNQAVPFARDKKFRFTFFSAGTLAEGGCDTPTPHNCQPVQMQGNSHLAILGGPKASGLWFAHPDNLYSCIDGEINSICGHYREWGGSPNDPNISLGAVVPIDAATHQKHCVSN